MLSRLIPKPSNFRTLTLISSNFQTCQHPLQNHDFRSISRLFSTNNSGDANGRFPSFVDSWKISQESDAKFNQQFSVGRSPGGQEEEHSWLKANDVYESNVFGEIDNKTAAENTSEGYANAFAAEAPVAKPKGASLEGLEKLQEGERQLTAILKGPDRAFGDLVAASGITDAMLDSLIALKDFEGVEGLPPLTEIEDLRYEKNTRKSSRADIERMKQEEEAKARVRQVDEKGRAYGTGRRKCSIARVWVQPGDGKFTINDKQFDVYFPMLDHRAALLRPFSETKTLGLWDINCTVKGGGVTGQVGAIQLGISRALQNWEPELRPPLRAAGFLTRDPRVVERKKPGKAKARKSFQWVKR